VNNKTILILFLVTLVAAAAAAFGWYQTGVELRQSRVQFAASELQPVAALLKEDQGIIRELQNVPFTRVHCRGGQVPQLCLRMA
jgi:hypothetical protein